MTRKTFAELTTEVGALLPDNTTGEITPADMRTMLQDILDSIIPAYGAMVISSQYTLAAVGQTHKALPFQTVIAETTPEFVCNAAGGTVQRAQSIASTQILFQADFSGPSNREVICTILADGVATPFVGRVQTGGSAVPVSLNLVALQYKASPCVYSIGVTTDSGVNDVVFSNATLICSAVPVRSA
jgi:hypothetical protein